MPPSTLLPDADSQRREKAGLQAFLDERLGGKRGLRILDAGCGRALHVKLGEHPWVVGMDIADESLEANRSLSERIVGDIQTHPLEPERFDVVICWDVLEHLPRPTLALQNMTHTLRPGGLLVIAGPNVMSLKGLATKFTPLAFHRFAYRRMGSAATQPFPTFMRFSIAPSRIAEWARSSPATVVERIFFYEAPIQVGLRRRLRLTGRAWSWCRALARALTFGRVDPARTDFFMVLRRT